MITAGYGEQIFERMVSDRIPDFMGQVYEVICREWLLQQLGQNLSPISEAEKQPKVRLISFEEQLGIIPES